MPVYPGPSGPTLVNTVLFNATWSEIFNPDNTIDEEFTFRDGTRQMGRFMHDLRYLEVVNFNDQSPALRDASAVLLDYGTGLTEFTAMFVLPADETEEAMDDVIFGLQEQSLSDLLNDTSTQEVKLSLPRFEVSFGPSSLKDELQNMGIEDAFDGSIYNKFDEMSKDDLLTVQDVLTGTTIRVTERGTEASAVTVVTMVGSARPSKVIDMNFNRPFVMSIIHKPTGTPIFIGRIEQPDLILEDPEVEYKDDDYWA
jgi:serpin B